MRTSVFDLTPESLESTLADWNEPKYRAAQILQWVYHGEASRFDEMTNLSRTLRARLDREFVCYQSEVVQRQESNDGTVKCLLRWPDRATSECVLIPDGERRTVCVSTQVGCPAGCVFCASGIGGLERQLPAGQIVEQAMRVRTLCGDARLSHVVFMGLGEPLANYDATVRAVRTINAPWGLAIGARRITVSTVGLPEQMRKLADEGLQIKLALSLHAPTDELRRRLIPWASHFGIDALVDAADYYFQRTTREVTLEYILLHGVNDTPAHAAALAGVAGRMRSNVNLLIYNPVYGLEFSRPPDDMVTAFVELLRERGVNAHVRRSRGIDIDAACGQLRRDHALPGREAESQARGAR